MEKKLESKEKMNAPEQFSFPNDSVSSTPQNPNNVIIPQKTNISKEQSEKEISPRESINEEILSDDKASTESSFLSRNSSEKFYPLRLIQMPKLLWALIIFEAGHDFYYTHDDFFLSLADYINQVELNYLKFAIIYKSLWSSLAASTLFMIIASWIADSYLGKYPALITIILMMTGVACAHVGFKMFSMSHLEKLAEVTILILARTSEPLRLSLIADQILISERLGLMNIKALYFVFIYRYIGRAIYVLILLFIDHVLEPQNIFTRMHYYDIIDVVRIAFYTALMIILSQVKKKLIIVHPWFGIMDSIIKYSCTQVIHMKKGKPELSQTPNKKLTNLSKKTQKIAIISHKLGAFLVLFLCWTPLYVINLMNYNLIDVLMPLLNQPFRYFDVVYYPSERFSYIFLLFLYRFRIIPTLSKLKSKTFSLDIKCFYLISFVAFLSYIFLAILLTVFMKKTQVFPYRLVIHNGYNQYAHVKLTINDKPLIKDRWNTLSPYQTISHVMPESHMSVKMTVVRRTELSHSYIKNVDKHYVCIITNKVLVKSGILKFSTEHESIVKPICVLEDCDKFFIIFESDKRTFRFSLAKSFFEVSPGKYLVSINRENTTENVNKNASEPLILDWNLLELGVYYLFIFLNENGEISSGNMAEVSPFTLLQLWVIPINLANAFVFMAFDFTSAKFVILESHSKLRTVYFALALGVRGVAAALLLVGSVLYHKESVTGFTMFMYCCFHIICCCLFFYLLHIKELYKFIETKPTNTGSSSHHNASTSIVG